MGRKKEITFFCVISALLLIILICGLFLIKSTDKRKKTSEDNNYISKTITVDGKEYFPKQDITTLVVMGIDQTGPVTKSELYTNPGAADAIFVVVFNETQKTMNILSINRDTMTDVPVLGVGGRQAGTNFEQIALSHNYGDGLMQSCENTRNAVSNLLGGIKIDYYLSMNMDALSIANDAIGGVVVNVTDDFSAVDSTIGMGEQRLSGEQALTYVRSRKDVGDQNNLSRMNRQEEYIEGFIEAFKESTEEDIRTIENLYGQIEPYVVTDCSFTMMTELFERAGKYEFGETKSPAGELVKGKDFYEFYADEEDLQKLILDYFYAEKK